MITNHNFNDKIIQNLVDSVNGVLCDLKDINDYEKVISSVCKDEIEGIFDNDGEKKAAIVLEYLYASSKNKIAVYTDTFTGAISNTDRAVSGWEKAIQNNPNILIQVLMEKEPSNHTRVFKLISDHIKNTGNGEIRMLSKNAKKYLDSAFKDNIRHSFSLGDNNKVRYQVDNTTRQALCSFNNTRFNTELRFIFDEAFKDSSPIALL